MQIQKIINGLLVFEKYNENAVPQPGSGNETIRVQEIEFKEISEEDREALKSFGWSNKMESPYLWVLK